MIKQVNFFLGISLAMIIISLSVTSAYALHEITFTLVDTITEDLNYPTDMVVDSTGRLIVANLLGYNVQIYDADGTLVHTIADADGDSGPRDGFSSPNHVAVDSNDRIIVTDGDNDRTQVFNSDGSFAFSISSSSPRGVAVDSEDRIIIAEVFDQRLQIYSPTGVLVDTISDGDNLIKDVWDVTVDSNDRIIATEYNRNVYHIFNSGGTLVETVTTPGSNQRGIATDYLDRILITDQSNEQIHIYNSTADFVTTLSHEDKDFQGITTACGNRVIVADILKDSILFFDLYIHEEEETSDTCPTLSGGNSNSCNGDCTAPSLESFEFNNTSNWFTAKNQTFNIGDKQMMKFVYHENEGIDDINDVEIGFGLPYLGSPLYKAELKLKINTNQGNFTSLEIDDKNKLFLENSTTVNIDQVQCGYNECLEYTLEFIWAEIPFDGYFLITASDDHNNTTYDRNEEPFTVIGETLNEEPTITLYNRYTSTMQDGFFIDITRTDKVTDMWIDDKGKYWCGLGNDRFELVH